MTIVTLQAVDLTPYGKPAFGRLPTGLGKPAAGFPQLHNLDDDEVHFSLNLGLTLYRGTFSELPNGMLPACCAMIAGPSVGGAVAAVVGWIEFDGREASISMRRLATREHAQ